MQRKNLMKQEFEKVVSNLEYDEMDKVISLIKDRQVLLVINNFDRYLLDQDFYNEFKRVMTAIHHLCKDACILYTINQLKDELEFINENVIKIQGLSKKDTVALFKQMTERNQNGKKVSDENYVKLIEYENSQNHDQIVPHFDPSRFLNEMHDYKKCQDYQMECLERLQFF